MSIFIQGARIQVNDVVEFVKPFLAPAAVIPCRERQKQLHNLIFQSL